MSKDNGRNGETTALQTAGAKEKEIQLSGPPPAAVGKLGLQIQDLQTMWWLSCRVAGSNLAPADCRTAEDVFVRAQCGMAAGLNFMQSLQYVANIHGRPTIWGPPLKGLILASGKCKSWVERYEGTDPFKDNFAAIIETERVDLPGIHEIRFSTAMAKRAGLMSRDTYKQYPEDMILHRAVGRAARRIYPDVIGGLWPAEDSGDIIEVNAREVKPSGKPKTMDDLAGALENSGQGQERENVKDADVNPGPQADPEGDDGDDDAPFAVDAETGEILDAPDAAEVSPEAVETPAGALF